ncbi:MAG: Nif3-like dinuclear metal center hexameric protein [Bacteroidales bacterium]
MKVAEVIAAIEEFAPVYLQESYDNSGLCVGNTQNSINNVVLCLDVNESTIDFALQNNANLILSHHPVVFEGLKQLRQANSTERIVERAIKHDITLYSAHTNLDKVYNGVSAQMSARLELRDCQVLATEKNQLVKISTFVPIVYSEQVRQAVFSAGAGHIDKYSCCSFNTKGVGTFCASEGAQPFVGEINKLHSEVEEKIEFIAHISIINGVITALCQAHPYEEVAYDIYPLLNKQKNVGLGMIGNLPQPMPIDNFLSFVKNTFHLPFLKYSNTALKRVQRIAVCGGSGGSLLNDAIRSKADVYITGDLKYHQMSTPENQMLIMDIGHYESEIAVIDIFFEIITKKISNFAPRLLRYSKNMVNYL